jgi:hypothetical protein
VKHGGVEAGLKQFGFRNDFGVAAFDYPPNAQLRGVQTSLDFRKHWPPNTKAEGKIGPNLARQQRVTRVFEARPQIFKEVLRQMGEIDGKEQIGIGRSRLKCGSDSGKGTQAGQAIGQLVTAYHLDLVGDILKEIDHMLKHRLAVPIEQGFIPAHSSAFAPS